MCIKGFLELVFPLSCLMLLLNTSTTLELTTTLEINMFALEKLLWIEIFFIEFV